MKRGSTAFLKVVIGLIGLLGLAYMMWFPSQEGRAADLSLVEIYLNPFILFMYTASIPFFVALYQSFKLLGFVDKNQMFTLAAVQAVATIKYCAMTFVGFMLTALAYVFVLSRTSTEDGAGAMMLGMIIIFATSAIATAAAVFQKMLQNGVDLKLENDLTV